MLSFKAVCSPLFSPVRSSVCNISPKEWVLRGESVLYVSFAEIKRALQHDFDMEKEFSYRNLNHTEMIRHFAKFIFGIWQIHPFREATVTAPVSGWI